jgi:hypothetical protein
MMTQDVTMDQSTAIFNNVLQNMGPLNVDNYFLLQNKLLEEAEEISKINYFIIPQLLDMGMKHLQENMVTIFDTSCLNKMGHSKLEVQETHMLAFTMNLQFIQSNFLEYSKQAIAQTIRDIRNDERLQNSDQVNHVLEKYESMYKSLDQRIINI